MTDEEFFRIRDFLKGRYGIDMSRTKTIMEGRLENYVRRNGWSSYSAYMDAVMTEPSGALEKKLVDLLTTNHTYFMREFEHFEFLKQEVLPWLKKKQLDEKDLRIWCAASSSGEEPYTIAMTVMDFFGLEHDKWDTKILATDVSDGILREAVRGVYASEQLAGLPENWKRRYFRKIMNEDAYRVTEELKNEVLFRKFNLMEPFPFKKPMQVIFLRNVMIYFDDKTKYELLQKIYDFLEPGGYLFLGKTETLDKQAIPFKLVQPAIFRK